ncbi:MAG: alpha-glucan family phosphorylase [Myxococcales bacterium]|nr:alpha-glucan family phosphorylase [Myxococcales bacterium]
MPSIRRFTVIPRLPTNLEPLRTIAHNLWWTWTPSARALFLRIDEALFESVHANPIELLSRAPQARLEELSRDDAFLAHLDAVAQGLDRYMTRESWFQKAFPDASGATIAYFSMEYGLHESLPIYSGGLGVLAGDHLKTASDLGVPLVGVGLAYAEGYFRQVLNSDGWQTERYPINDWSRLPVQPVLGPTGTRLVLDVQYPERIVKAQVWRVQVGRVPLFLLDANLEENAPIDRSVTGPLYGGDQEFRVRQEIMLGIGGVHALEAMGLTATVCHMNEGHSAFLTLERVRRTMEREGVSFAVANEACCAGHVFTTHTPVPAGNDAFAPALVTRYLEPYRAALALTEGELLTLGRADPLDPTSPFSMPVFAIHNADHRNGVSALHGEVSRRMWKDLWPELPEHEVPILSVTNGVHTPSWISREMAALFTRYLGPRWVDALAEPEFWARVRAIPDAELWETHEARRYRLIQLCRQWLCAAAEKRGASPAAQAELEEVLDPRALTIGFARRFATYKRAALLFRDIERVKRLLCDPERPVQLVFAGKAHPQDKGGKELIRSIVQHAQNPELRGRVVFVEDYDMRIARALVAGVDVWLNNPRRPHEASGTSGMKAAANGALNLSILDGWWAEAYEEHGREVGWAIGHGEEFDDDDGDDREAEILYDLLEREVVPLFYDREAQSRLPREWIRRMKQSIACLVPSFNTARMVREYTERFYVPAIASSRRLREGALAGARELVAWKQRVRAGWEGVAVLDVALRTPTELRVGEPARVEVLVALGDLTPGDVVVELYHGPTEGGHDLPRGATVRMAHLESVGREHRYVGEVPTIESGAYGVSARIAPASPRPTRAFPTALLRWA